MLKIDILVVLLLLHILAFIGFFVIKNINIYTIILQFFIFIISGLGITVGYHRLWCHRSFEATPLLQWILMLMSCSAGQGQSLQWCKTHRTHHRNEDLFTDPYSISKGFWFAHIGWLLQYPNEETQKEIDKTDISDLTDNTVLQFQKKYYVFLWIIISFILPLLITKLWNETITNALFSTVIRVVISLHSTWCVNSLAHMYGDKPYNSEIRPSENLFVSLITFGEGWHNFHHTYPKDYRASSPDKYNPSSQFIDFMKTLGLASNLYEKCKNTEKVRGMDKFDKNNYCKLE